MTKEIKQTIKIPIPEFKTILARIIADTFKKQVVVSDFKVEYIDGHLEVTVEEVP